MNVKKQVSAHGKANHQHRNFSFKCIDGASENSKNIQSLAFSVVSEKLFFYLATIRNAQQNCSTLHLYEVRLNTNVACGHMTRFVLLVRAKRKKIEIEENASKGNHNYQQFAFAFSFSLPSR